MARPLVGETTFEKVARGFTWEQDYHELIEDMDYDRYTTK